MRIFHWLILLLLTVLVLACPKQSEPINEGVVTPEEVPVRPPTTEPGVSSITDIIAEAEPDMLTGYEPMAMSPSNASGSGSGVGDLYTGNNLGKVTIDVTGTEAAVAHFQQGLLLLHSFEYEDAREAFLAAQAADQAMVMAYWGEAMTYNHPLWRAQEREDGQAALDKLAPTQNDRISMAQSTLERDLLTSVDILYNSEGEKLTRDRAYRDFMAKLLRKYDTQHEVATFYALSVLGAVPVGRDEEDYEKAARIVQGVVAENPNHPGALHYLIHAYDDPSHAAKAIPAARSYSQVAPSAAHALHMPSHIYVSMGMWDRVVRSNIDSWNASVNRMKRKGLDDNARSYHAFHWYIYGLTQQGRHAEARERMEEFKQYTQQAPDRKARSYMVTVLANYMVETEDWENNSLWEISESRDDINILFRSIYHFMDGMRAYRQKDAANLAEVITSMTAEVKNAANSVTSEGVPMCSAISSGRSAPNQQDIDQARVLIIQLQAMQAELNGDLTIVENYLLAATDLELQLDYSYGPPRIVMPSFELYGFWLLEQGRPTEALQQFNYALEKGPGRARALRGAWQAAAALYDEQRADSFRELLERNFAKSDTDVRERVIGDGVIRGI